MVHHGFLVSMANGRTKRLENVLTPLTARSARPFSCLQLGH